MTFPLKTIEDIELNWTELDYGNRPIYTVVLQQMGLPVRKLICASNQNNVLSELINTGHYNVASRGSKVIPTISPAIDILRASNVERYLHHAVGRNGHAISQAYRELDSAGRFRLSPQVRRCSFCLYEIVEELLMTFCSLEECMKISSHRFTLRRHLPTFDDFAIIWQRRPSVWLTWFSFCGNLPYDVSAQP